MDRRAADRLVAAGSGDGALLYLWLLSQGGILTPSAARKALKWDDVRLGEAVAALKALGDEERQIVLLHAVSGMKHRELSELLELPLSTVLSKYARALAKLKKALTSHSKEVTDHA